MNRYAGAIRDGSNLSVQQRRLVMLSCSRIDTLNPVRVGVGIPFLTLLFSALITGDESGRNVKLVGGARK